MDFDYRILVACIFGAAAFFEAVTIRKLLQRLSDKVDALDALAANVQSQAADAAHEASTAKQAALNLLDEVRHQRNP